MQRRAASSTLVHHLRQAAKLLQTRPWSLLEKGPVMLIVHWARSLAVSDLAKAPHPTGIACLLMARPSGSSIRRHLHGILIALPDVVLWRDRPGPQTEHRWRAKRLGERYVSKIKSLTTPFSCSRQTCNDSANCKPHRTPARLSRRMAMRWPRDVPYPPIHTMPFLRGSQCRSSLCGITFSNIGQSLLYARFIPRRQP